MAVALLSTATLVDRRMLFIDVYGTVVVVTVTSTPSVFRRWIRNSLYFNRLNRHRLLVGLGVQWVPSSGPAATLQLCIGRRCLIFQLHHAPTVPRLLRRFLSNPEHTFVGLWNHSDARKLEQSKHVLVMFREPLDLRKYAASESDGSTLYRDSIDTIVKECLGMNINYDENISISDWDAEYLNQKQITQAAMDAYCSFLIGMKLEAWEYIHNI